MTFYSPSVGTDRRIDDVVMTFPLREMTLMTFYLAKHPQ